MNQTNLYKMALSLIPKVGPLTARKLVAYLGGVDAVFEEKKSRLLKVPGVGETILKHIQREEILKQAEKELLYLEKNGHNWISYLDKEYPARLKECEDAPVVLFYKGKNVFNNEKMVSIVGTRNCTDVGQENCKKLVGDLAEAFPELVVVSGFAYGVDICAHKAAIENNLNTIAVLGTGIDVVYPAYHARYVKPVMKQGALVSEFPSSYKADPGNFVSRNRIIAGLADATLVVESKNKGGALITADMANSYNRDVFAFPGRIGDAFASGCNNLIKQNKAALIESAKDMISFLQWDVDKTPKPVQQKLFDELPEDEQKVFGVLQQNETVELDSLAKTLGQPVPKISAILLTLEFKGVVKSLPGKQYRVV